MSPLKPVLFAFVAAALVPACAQNPATGQSDFVLMGEAQEITIGREAHDDIIKRFGRYDDPALQSYVQKIGEQLAARSHRSDLVYRFTVLDSEDVNAFALPGGYIYINRGLLALLNSEAEMAAVLGHEIGHVTARHSVRQYSAQTAAGIGYTLGSILLPELRGPAIRDTFGLLSNALLRGYGREHELEADGLGAEYLARTGYDPDAMLEVIGVLKDQETFAIERARKEGREPNVYHGLFATHPDNDTRLKEVVGKARALKASSGKGRVNRKGYLNAIAGMTYGPSAKQGVLRGRDFYHADLGITLRFPGGWRVENRPDRLIAASPSNDALLQVQLQDLNKRIPPEQFMSQRLGLKLQSGRPLESGAGPAYTGLAESDTPFGRRLARFIVVYFRDQAYIFAGAQKDPANSRAFEDAFIETALSLKALGESERQLAQERRIILIEAEPGTRYSALAKRSPLSRYAEAQLRLINGDYPKGEPAAGRLIKTIE